MGQSLSKFSKILEGYAKIALDSSCFIYHIEENKKYSKLTRIIFEELLPTRKIEAVGSTLILTEILTKPYSHNRPDLVSAYKNSIIVLPNFAIIPPDEQMCDTAALIRSKYNLRTPDAIHLATAIETDSRAIVGNDLKWKKIKEINCILLAEFLTP